MDQNLRFSVFMFLVYFGLYQQANSQTFNGMGGLLIPPGAPTETVGITISEVDVIDIGVLGGCKKVSSVTMDLEHSWVGDIAIFLISPDGTVFELSSGNGGAGDNFQVTTFSDDAPIFITDGTAPFNGTYRPEGRQQDTDCLCSDANNVGTYTFKNTFTGEDADGIWQLYINDYVFLDVGELNSWSITFSDIGVPPVAFPASIEGCDEGGGIATFDLTSVDNIVNGGTGDHVDYYMDNLLNNLIITPESYQSSAGSVWAVVENADCRSDSVEITLTIVDGPDAFGLDIEVCDNCAGWNWVDYTLLDNQVNGGSGFQVNWWFDAAATIPIPMPDSVQVSGGSAWATVDDGICESAPVEITSTMLIPNCGSTASLIKCDDGSGTAVFDLTSLDPIVNNGTSDLVEWYEDMAATLLIANPENYMSAGGTVFAIIDNGICPSPGILVDLIVSPGINPTEVDFSIDPLIICGVDNVQLSFDLPSATGYDVVIEYGNTGSGFTTWSQTVFEGTNYAFLISETTIFRWISVVDAVDGCFLDFDPVPELTVEVFPEPIAFSANLEGCDTDGSGTVVFDLTTIETIINGGTSNPVNWYSDPGAIIPIPDPSSYETATGSVYATVQSGLCSSDPVEIQLEVFTAPLGVSIPLDGCDEGGGIGTFNLTTIENLINISTGNDVNWFSDPGANIPIPNPDSYQSGEGLVYVTVSDGICESEIIQIPLNIVPAPTIDNSFITPNPSVLCGSTNVSITFTMPEVDVAFDVTMDYGNPTSGYQEYIGVNVFDGSSVPFVINETTEFILTHVAVQENNFCSVEFTNPVIVTVEVLDPPDLDQLIDPEICEGEEFDLQTAVTTTSGLPITFHSATPPSSGNELPSTLITPLVSTTYYAFIDAGTDCSAELPINVTVNEPFVPLLSPGQVCENDSNFDLTGLLQPPFLDGIWSGQGVTGTNFDATGLTGIIELTFTPSEDCTENAVTFVTITQEIFPQLNSASVCESNTIFDLTTLEDPNYPGGDWSGPGVIGSTFNANGLSGDVELTYSTPDYCTSDASSTIEIVNPPSVLDIQFECNPDNTQYSVSFSIQNGDPGSYLVNNISSDGNYTSVPINSGDNYLFEVDDANGCGPVTISGNFDCACETFSGTMNLPGSVQEYCVTDTATAEFNNDEMLDADDLLLFIFHDNSGPTLGTILAINTTATFTFPIGANSNTIYYISSVAGTSDGSGSIDLSDPCLSVSSGVPVRFNSITAALSLENQICANECANLKVQFEGVPPYTLIYSIEEANRIILDTFISNSSTDTVQICPSTLGLSDTVASIIPIVYIDGIGCQLSFNPANSFELNIIPSIEVTVEEVLCSGDSVVINGNTYNENNPIGSENLVSVDGCDSIIEINLEFYDRAEFDLISTLCIGDSLIINGTTYNESNQQGIEILSGQSTNGCDSIININLSFTNAITNNINDIICEGDSIIVNGTIYDINNSSGTEIIPNGSQSGCDSIIEITLSFFTPLTSNLDPILCPGEFVIVNGTRYDENNPTGSETFEDAASNGCDSVLNINLTYLQVSRSQETFQVCTGDSIVINGTVYNENNPSGEEIFQGAAINGCDSILEVSLEFKNPLIISLEPFLCPGDSITINGTVYDEANPLGTEIIIGGASNGCDSIILVEIQYLSHATTVINETLAIGDSILVNGTIYNIDNPTGIEVFEGQARNGCDSIVDIQLNFTSQEIVLTFEVNSPLCTDGMDGQIIIWNISGGTGVFEISLDDKPFEPITSLPYLISNLSAGNYSIKIRDEDGNATTVQITVLDPPPITLDLGPDISVEIGDNAFLFANTNFAPASIEWSPTDYLTCTDCLNPVVSLPESSIQYSLTLIDSNNCEVSDQIAIAVRVSRNLYIPTAFSPNGDGINDHFSIYSGGNISIIKSFKIYDRWGNLVHHRENLNVDDSILDWDGTAKGKHLGPGVFSYWIEAEFSDGTTKLFKGDVSIIK